MKRPSGFTMAAGVCAALIGLLYLSPVLKDVLRTGLDWPIWIDHPEGLIHTNTGKWLVAPPHRHFVDGNTGEFPIYYPSLFDTLLNVVGRLVGAPVMTVQAVLFGPPLGSAFLFLNYLSLGAVLKDRRVALVASLILSLGGNSSFVDRPEPVSGLPLNAIFHVPFYAISLGTAQSLGWVLLLPTLSLCTLAYRDFSRSRALGAGLLLGALFHAHTLTFVNVAAVELVFLILANGLGRPHDRRFRAWLVVLGVLGGAFVGLVASQPAISFASLAALGTLALAATFVIDPNKRFYLWSYLPAALVAFPYVLVLVRHPGPLAVMQGGWEHVQMMTVGLAGFALFFAAYLLGAATGWWRTRDRSLRVWLGAMLIATAFLAINHLWHWGNHPYRYAIHLLFPLAILTALGLRDAPRPAVVVLGIWLGAIGLFDATSFALGRPGTVRFRVAEAERARFLETVRTVTRNEAGGGQRLLPPVEFTYPRGLVQAAMVMNYSRIPAFIPDYRHVLWPERYHNRMGLFCFLFPGIPNEDYPFGWRACDEKLDPDPQRLTIREPRLKTQVLPLYRIGFAAAPGKPFSSHVKEAAALYGWPVVAETDSAALVRTETAALPGVARLTAEGSTGGTLAIRVEPESAGAHVVILGGRSLARRAPRIVLDGRPLEGGRRDRSWSVFEAELAAGAHRLELPALETGPDPEADYLYFAAVVERAALSRYVDLAGDWR